MREADKSPPIDSRATPNYVELRRDLRQELRRQLNQQGRAEQMSETELQAFIDRQIQLELLGKDIGLSQRRQLQQELFHSFRGLDLLQGLLDDPEVSEIMVNGPERVFVERRGRLWETGLRFDDRGHLEDLIRYMYARQGREINLSVPIADLRLADGSRAHAVLHPVAPDGPALTIRKFCGIRPSAQALIDSGFIPEARLIQLQNFVKEGRSLFICGGTGTGKTTLLNILSQSIPPDERLVTVEDSAELQLPSAANLVRLECRSPGPDGSGGVDMGQLIRAALRMRPDRLIVGEVRGAEAWDLLQAMNTGHPGSLSTAHANSCLDMLRRLAQLILAASRLPYEAIVDNLSANIDYLIHIRRSGGRRFVQEIAELRPPAGSRFRLRSLYRLAEKGVLSND